MHLLNTTQKQNNLVALYEVQYKNDELIVIWKKHFAEFIKMCSHVCRLSPRAMSDPDPFAFICHVVLLNPCTF